MNKARILLLCTSAAVAYGVIHDQITVRLCAEYFTVAHPRLFPVTSPTLLALCWGIATTIGLGAVLGLVLALVAESGPRPPIASPQLRRPIARLLLLMAASALAAGLCGYFLARSGAIHVPAHFAKAIPLDRHPRFLAATFAHLASYLLGLAGSTHLVFRTWKDRGRPAAFTILPQSPRAALRATAITALAAYLLWRRFSSR